MEMPRAELFLAQRRQVRRHDHPSEADILYARKVIRAAFWVMQHVVKKGRHEKKRIDFLLLDHLHSHLCIPGSLADQRPVQQYGHQHRAHTHCMKNRHDAKARFTALIIKLGNTVGGCEPFSPMRTRHTFRAARGTGRIKHQAEFAVIDRRRPVNGW